MGGGCKSTGVVEDLFMLMCVARILEGTRGGVIHVRLMKRREAEDGSVEGSGDSRRGLNPHQRVGSEWVEGSFSS
jgi:hypothetical protein